MFTFHIDSPIGWAARQNRHARPFISEALLMGGKPTNPLEIDCESVKRKLDAGEKFLFLDCRERDEHETVHIGAATLLPMSELMERVGELEPHRDAEVVVHCHHGGRSLKVASWLKQQGFQNTKSMAGGIDEWALQIDKTLPRY